MKRTGLALMAMVLVFLFAFSLIVSCSVGGGDDDDDDTGDDDSGDDDTGDDDDDGELSWEDRCEHFVHAYYETCEHALFDLAEEDAVEECISKGLELPWECIVECWETTGDCDLWYYCAVYECGVPPGDEDDDDDSD